MVKTNFKKIISIALSTAMVAGAMASSAVFADSDDRARAANSSSTGTIAMGKTLTVSEANKFPNLTTFNYELERIRAWDNSNVDTAESGEVIAKANMPMPAASNTQYHTVTVSGDKATVQIGNFLGSPETTDATYGTTDAADTSTVKERHTDVPITFTKAGYYVYKVKEISSTPDAIPGVTYDDHEYFIVFYVCNAEDNSGNTEHSGVYVHSITSFRNESGLDTYQPDLSEISNTTDNGGTAAVANTRENLGKVGISSSEKPNLLKADNMWNDMITHDLTISKNVKGSLGDVNKEFEFTVTLTGLQPSTTYQLSGDVALKGTPSVGTYDSTNQTITTDANGAATFIAKLKDDEAITIEGLNASSHYTVSEAASDHIASYAITSDNAAAPYTYTAVPVGEMENGTTYYYENDGTDTEVDPQDIEAGTTTVYSKAANAAAAVIATPSGANQANQTALATAQETIDPNDGDQTVAYTNTRDIETVTGVPDAIVAMLAAAAVLVVLGAIFVARRRSYEED